MISLHSFDIFPESIFIVELMCLWKLINFLVLIEDDRLWWSARRHSEEEVEVGISEHSLREASRLARVDCGVIVVCSFGEGIRHE